MNKKNKHR